MQVQININHTQFEVDKVSNISKIGPFVDVLSWPAAILLQILKGNKANTNLLDFLAF